ncbi:MAG: hypothetical protein HXY34_13185, partial [Candidatus Thorarchaeota archaeon]|nr:hypothetical protein [Candidatus Thorarchaeota archaeon]
AAASALEFVESLEAPDPKAALKAATGDAVAGFDALLRKLETLRSDISSLQRGVVGVFAAQLLTFRGKVVELKSRISEEMVEKLRMPMMKTVIESSFTEIVDSEFSALEKDLVDRIVEQTQERFKEFATKVRESESDLRQTIVEQQDIVRSFLQGVEEDGLAVREQLREREAEVKELQKQIEALHAQIDMGASSDTRTQELSRKVGEFEAKLDSARRDVVKKDSVIQAKDAEIARLRSQVEQLQLKLSESSAEVQAYKSQLSAAPKASARSDAEVQAMKTKLELTEASLAEKRREVETQSGIIRELEAKLRDALVERKAAEEASQKRVKELESVQDRIRKIKDMEERIYNLERELEETKKRIPIVEMQREAYEKATRLMEKERDMALEMRDVANERAARYIKALGVEASTKVLLIVDEVGSITFADLGKTLGIQPALAAKYARELDKLGVLRVEDEKAISTLRSFELKEGEVKV